LYPEVKAEPCPEIRLPLYMLGAVILRNPLAVEDEPEKLRFMLPYPSGERSIDPLLPTPVCKLRDCPSKVNFPVLDLTVGEAAEIPKIPFWSIKGTVAGPAGEAGGNPCKVSALTA
jgi:hypothetical protein